MKGWFFYIAGRSYVKFSKVYEIGPLSSNHIIFKMKGNLDSTTWYFNSSSERDEVLGQIKKYIVNLQ